MKKKVKTVKASRPRHASRKRHLREREMNMLARLELAAAANVQRGRS